MAKKRMRLSKSGSRRSFTKNARRVHPKNGLSGGGAAMRGGIRL